MDTATPDTDHGRPAFRICLATQHAKAVFLPLALMYIKATLVERGGIDPADVSVLELPVDEPNEVHMARILAQNPDVVGLSCYVWNVTAMHVLGRALKQHRPEVKIVLGGPEVGPVARTVMTTHPYVDVIVRSEGELPMMHLVEAWRSNASLHLVQGICFRDGEALVETPDAPVLRDLNELPSPHQDLYAPYDGRSVAIETQRGCVFRCSFCFYNKELSIRNRRFDLDRVTREIDYWLARDIRALYLMDPVFNLNLSRAKEICRFLAAHNRRGVRIHAEIWAEFVDEELAQLMKDAGFSYLEVGLQTTEEAVLAAVDRRLRLKPFLDGLDHLQRVGLRYELHLIYGLPGETQETFRRALDFAAALGPPRLSIFMLMVLPGTQLWRDASTFDLEFESDPPYHVLRHTSMTPADVDAGWALVAAQRWFRRSAVVRLLARWPGIGLSATLDAWSAWRAGRQEFVDATSESVGFLEWFCTSRQVPMPFVRALLEHDAEHAFADADVDRRATSPPDACPADVISRE